MSDYEFLVDASKKPLFQRLRRAKLHYTRKWGEEPIGYIISSEEPYDPSINESEMGITRSRNQNSIYIGALRPETIEMEV